MAKVFQMIAINENDKHFEAQVVNGDWHTAIVGDRTLCGLQTESDDGYSPGEAAEGIVTCAHCLFIIERVKAIRNWK